MGTQLHLVNLGAVNQWGQSSTWSDYTRLSSLQSRHQPRADHAAWHIFWGVYFSYRDTPYTLQTIRSVYSLFKSFTLPSSLRCHEPGYDTSIYRGHDKKQP